MRTVEEVLVAALQRISRGLDKRTEYLEILKNDWYSEIDDLQKAIEDGQSWSDIKLPGRLKLEMKQILSQLRDSNAISWEKCFSTEDNCFYYYNSSTRATEWDISIGTKYIDTDGSIQVRSESHIDKTDEELLESLQNDMSLHSDTNSIKSAQQVHQSIPINVTIAQLTPTSTSITRQESLSIKEGSLQATGSYPMLPPLLEVRTPMTPVRNHFNSSNQSNVLSQPITDLNNNETTTNTIEQAFETIDEDFVVDDSQLQRLLEMGFKRDDCIEALTLSGNDLTSAATVLLQRCIPNQEQSSSPSNKVDSNEVTPRTSKFSFVKWRVGSTVGIETPKNNSNNNNNNINNNINEMSTMESDISPNNITLTVDDDDFDYDNAKVRRVDRSGNKSKSLGNMNS